MGGSMQAEIIQQQNGQREGSLGTDPVSSEIMGINYQLDVPGIDDTTEYCLQARKEVLDRRKRPRDNGGSLARVR